MLSQIREDSALNAFFERQLEMVKAKTFDIKFAELKSRSFIPTSNEGSPGVAEVTYEQYKEIGEAKILASNGKDVPRVDLSGKEFTRPARRAWAGYGFDYDEVWAARYAGKDLNAKKARTARKAVERVLDEVAAVGAPEFGIASGFINNPTVPITALAGGDDWQTLVAANDARRIVELVSNAWSTIRTRTKDVEAPDTILLPTAEHALIATTPFGDNSDKTVLEFIMKHFPGITAIEPWYRLDAAGAGDVTRMVMYPRSADVLEQEIVQEFTQLPPQEQGIETVVNTTAKTAGTAIYYPLAMQFVDGV